MYQKRTSRTRLLARADGLLLPQPFESGNRDAGLYNFEYYLNRCYAFNRDLGKCKVCGDFIADNVRIHHINPYLSSNLVNLVSNLASLHSECHEMVHDGNDYSSLPKKVVWLKILRLREKLNLLS
jgi:RNA-directed DNA polymerase